MTSSPSDADYRDIVRCLAPAELEVRGLLDEVQVLRAIELAELPIGPTYDCLRALDLVRASADPRRVDAEPLLSRYSLPRFRADARALFYRGKSAAFRPDATRQLEVLAAFEAEGWPRTIYLTFANLGARSAAEIRTATAKKLNGRVAPALGLRFYNRHNALCWRKI